MLRTTPRRARRWRRLLHLLAFSHTPPPTSPSHLSPPSHTRTNMSGFDGDGKPEEKVRRLLRLVRARAPINTRRPSARAGWTDAAVTCMCASTASTVGGRNSLHCLPGDQPVLQPRSPTSCPTHTTDRGTHHVFGGRPCTMQSSTKHRLAHSRHGSRLRGVTLVVNARTKTEQCIYCCLQQDCNSDVVLLQAAEAKRNCCYGGAYLGEQRT